MKAVDKNNLVVNACPACKHGNGKYVLDAPDRFHGRSTLYHLVKCPNCALVWTQNPPPPSRIGEHYGTDYDVSVTSAGENRKRWSGRCRVIEQLYPEGGTILDLGCSGGGFLASLKGDWRRYGIEMSELAAQTARARCGTEVFVGDILDAPFPAGTFDVVSCFHVFEHLYQPREVLERVFQWLKPGGVFYAMMPNIDSAGARLFGSHWYALELPRHLSHFSPIAIRKLASAVGLEPVSVTTHREVFMEQSAKYLFDSLFRRMGVVRRPLAQAKRPGIPYRLVRKTFRLTLRPILSGLAAIAGDGESIHAILRKPATLHQAVPAQSSLKNVYCGE